MSPERLSLVGFEKDMGGDETQGFMDDPERNLRKGESRRGSAGCSSAHIISLYVLNGSLLLLCLFLMIRLVKKPFRDPSLGVYSPANEAVEYIKEQQFRPSLFDNSPYMGFPTDETDQLWQDLYTFGISKITGDEAKYLAHPTLKIPGTEDYLIELDVWHELHCLNDLRTLLYPERFPGLAELTDVDGKINREDIMFRHWDHCIDSIRESLMCHADIAPIPFHINFPASQVIVPRLTTTHTCRNFTKIQDWAKSHQAGTWNYNVTAEQAETIMEASGFDNAPWEDIQDQYKFFPGNTYFKYWRDHPEEVGKAKKQAGTEMDA